MARWYVSLGLLIAALAWEYHRRHQLANFRLPSQLHPVYDFIVVGGGSAGSVLASRLSEDESKTVLLIEAGGTGASVPYSNVPGLMGRMQKTPLDWQLRTEPQSHSAQAMKGKRGVWPRGKVLGGSSLINSMIYLFGRRGDHERWEKKLGCKGWGWDDMLPFYRKSESVRFEGASESLRGLDGPIGVTQVEQTEVGRAFLKGAAELGWPLTEDLNGAVQEGFGRTQQAILAGQRQSGWEYLRRSAHRNNLHILLQAHVTKVLFDKDLQATGVRYLHDGRSLEARAAKEVILTAGAIHTPHLLMLSGIGAKAELEAQAIPVLVDQPHVGRHLQDHIMTGFMVFQINRRAGIPWAPLLSLETAKRALDYALFRHGPWNSTNSECQGLVHSGASPKTSVPDVQLQFTPGHKMGGLGVRNQGLRPEVEAAELAEATSDDLISVSSGLQRPFSEGSLRLVSPDPLVPPAIDPQHLSHPRDLDAIAKGLDLVVRIVRESSALAEFEPRSTEAPLPGCEGHQPWSMDYYRCFARHKTLTIYHPVSTARMGPTPGDSVVDLRLRVWGTRGLRVADAAVMPDIVSVNTNPAVVAVAEKAAALILEDHPLP